MEADDESEDETKLIILIIGAISDLRAAGRGEGSRVSRYHRIARARAQYKSRKSRMSEYTNNAMLQGHAIGDVLTLCGSWITNTRKRNCDNTQYYHIWHHRQYAS